MIGYIILGVVILLVVLAAVLFVKCYNKLVKLRNRVQDQWSQVDVQLKKRFDLIPNIVESVKGYAQHEKQTLNEIVELRNSALSAKTSVEEMNADNQLSGALNRLMVVSEAYPELKADANFRNLQDALKDVEDKIAYARQFYNDSVLKYKDALETFPTVTVAKLCGFKPAQFFEATATEKEVVKVQF
ncbi:MAG: LemA family protein [Oscillospiraceae bacterium]|nr:LemA family protein [Oscillospiraceae bacterium]